MQLDGAVILRMVLVMVAVGFVFFCQNRSAVSAEMAGWVSSCRGMA